MVCNSTVTQEDKGPNWENIISKKTSRSVSRYLLWGLCTKGAREERREWVLAQEMEEFGESQFSRGVLAMAQNATKMFILALSLIAIPAPLPKFTILMFNYREERSGKWCYLINTKNIMLQLKWLIWWCAYEWSAYISKKTSQLCYDYICKYIKTRRKKAKWKWSKDNRILNNFSFFKKNF